MENLSRRKLIRNLCITVAALPALAQMQMAVAADLPQVDENDPTAKALGYKHDSTKVDLAKYPKHTPAQLCGNCKLVQGEPKDWMPCQLFPGKVVNAKGWCAGYVAKA